MAEKEGSGGSHRRPFWIEWLAILFMMMSAASGLFQSGIRSRDGMVLKVDDQTGCEYLCGFYGLAGCTPRLGADAKPICKGGR
jgi:hypothetical protein